MADEDKKIGNTTENTPNVTQAPKQPEAKKEETVVKPEVKPTPSETPKVEEKKEEKKQAPVEQTKPEIAEQEELDTPEEVIITSADGRVLEAAINERTFKGKTISVPAELAEEVKRLLLNGGYFIK